MYKAHIRLKISSNKPLPVSDFSFTPFSGGPQISFIDSIADTDSLPNPAQSDMDPLLSVLDSHSGTRTLFAIEQALNGVLASRLRKNAKLTKTVDDLQNANYSCDEWHRLWPSKCSENKVAPGVCQQGSSVIEAWEVSRRQLIEKARQKWHEGTGVVVLSSDPNLSPSGDMDFTFDVGANESCFLRIDYNRDPSYKIGTSVEVLSSSIATTSEVVDEADLRAPFPLFMLQYHSTAIMVLLLGFSCALFFSWPAIRPKQLLPIDKVFREALRTDDEEYWEHAYQRYRFYVTQQFRDLRDSAHKPNLKPDSEELLDYIRNRLIDAYGTKPGKLRGEKKLKQFVNNELQALVTLLP
ncbi:MAG TPA: hypothetical protein VJ875_26865 [Pyrinomonadaceae bacterium]|nr:hypothetical protein [Pyrinomonadaceae bacterium]